VRPVRPPSVVIIVRVLSLEDTSHFEHWVSVSVKRCPSVCYIYLHVCRPSDVSQTICQDQLDHLLADVLGMDTMWRRCPPSVTDRRRIARRYLRLFLPYIALKEMSVRAIFLGGGSSSGKCSTDAFECTLATDQLVRCKYQRLSCSLSDYATSVVDDLHDCDMLLRAALTPVMLLNVRRSVTPRLNGELPSKAQTQDIRVGAFRHRNAFRCGIKLCMHISPRRSPILYKCSKTRQVEHLQMSWVRE